MTMLKNKILNNWPLFWLVSMPISLAMLIAMTLGLFGADLTSGEGISVMIQLSVRCAVPLLFLAFSASALHTLFPHPLTRWLLKNRKIIGLCFAAAMAWQLLFILWMVLIYRDYYVNEVYVLRDAIEGVLGYLFLTAMTLTSFKFARKHLKARNWKRLHTSGIYVLWAYAFSVYWWNLFYYSNPLPIDYVFYLASFSAWGVRAAAWAKTREAKNPRPELRFIGSLTILIGVIAAALGKMWQPVAEQYLSGYSFTQTPELYLPYWPFEPFLPLFIIAFGVFLITREKNPQNT
jgi:sulfoxide reductase heme-binding subunit YedZ